MSHVRRTLPIAVILLAVTACSDTDRPLAPEAPDLARAPAWQEPTDPDRLRDQRLARRFALALNNPVFRAEVLGALDGSRQREGRLHLQRFLQRGQGRALGRMAAHAGASVSEISADLTASPSMEVYLPVPAHRATWRGGTNLLVATAREDGEAPVAFDLQGRRRVLDPRTPPTEPVIALQTWEGKDDPNCDDTMTKDCSSSDGGGGYNPGDPTSPPTAAPGGGLFLTETRFFDKFESWLKGAPEFEIHVLGHKSGTTEMVSYQCIGEQAGGPYSWNQDDLTWSGSVLMFSQAQLDQFEAQHPGQGLRFLLLEDDDGPCAIKVNRERAADLFKAADKAYDAWTSGKQIKFTDFSKVFAKAKSFYDLISGLSSFFKSNDDIVGTAILDPGAAGAVRTGANWIVKNDRNIATGALRLEMR